MHFLKNLVFVVFVAVLLANLTTAQDAQKRSSLLNKRAGNKNIFQKSTTTTTEANDEEEEYVEAADVAPENEEQQEEQSESVATTTTEATKKIGPSVRPFRSNQDLLSTLKKRRLNEKNNKPAVTQKPVQEEKQYEQPEVKTTKAKPTAASSFASAGNRRFGGHKSTNVKAPVQDNQAQTIEDPTSKPFKRSNRFSLRQNN